MLPNNQKISCQRLWQHVIFMDVFLNFGKRKRGVPFDFVSFKAELLQKGPCILLFRHGLHETQVGHGSAYFGASFFLGTAFFLMSC